MTGTWLIRGLLAMLLLTGVGAVRAGTVQDDAAGVPAAAAGVPTQELLARGEYLTRAGDCVSCHTAQGGQPFAGGRAIPTPFGTIWSPNITPDKATGIGNWSAEDFWNAMHSGKAPHGRLLYPAFPYPSYTRVTRADVDAIHAWLGTLKPVHQPNQGTDLSFPYNLRKLLLAWRAWFFDEGEYQPRADKSAQWNRGAYLVRGLGHCAGCHAPRNALGATLQGKRLGGGVIPEQGWYAPDLGTGPDGGLHGWSEQDIVDLLHTGRSARGTAYGPMAEVVQNSLQYLREADVRAIAVYLLDQPPREQVPRRRGIAPPPRQSANLLAEGRELYERSCSGCHGKDGRGRGVYPPLAGNTSMLAPNPVNAVRMVLLGGFAPSTKGNPRPYSMPPFMQKLNDREVAAVVSWIRHAWGNDASVVSPEAVSRYRSTPAH